MSKRSSPAALTRYFFRQGMAVSAMLLPVLALVVLLSLARPAGVVQADPIAVVEIDMDPIFVNGNDCSVAVDVDDSASGAQLVDDNCGLGGGDSVDSFDSFGTGAFDSADADLISFGATI